MKKIMFGNSLMLLGIAIMILAGLELIYIGIMWASFLLIPVGFIMAVIGFFRAYLKTKYSCTISTKSKWKQDGQKQERTQQAYHSV